MKTMKINFDKLKVFETTHADSISIGVINQMIEILINPAGTVTESTKISKNTLLSLGILEEEKEVQQLNS